MKHFSMKKLSCSKDRVTHNLYEVDDTRTTVHDVPSVSSETLPDVVFVVGEGRVRVPRKESRLWTRRKDLVRNGRLRFHRSEGEPGVSDTVTPLFIDVLRSPSDLGPFTGVQTGRRVEPVTTFVHKKGFCSVRVLRTSWRPNRKGSALAAVSHRTSDIDT